MCLFLVVVAVLVCAYCCMSACSKIAIDDKDMAVTFIMLATIAVYAAGAFSGWSIARLM